VVQDVWNPSSALKSQVVSAKQHVGLAGQGEPVRRQHCRAELPRCTGHGDQRNLRSLFSWLQSAGYTTETGVNQIDFGFELCSTSGQSATFTVTDYSLDATCASGTSC
jgi:hypothetical protein